MHACTYVRTHVRTHALTYTYARTARIVQVPMHGITLENITVDSYSGVGDCRWADVTATNLEPPFPKCANTPPPPPPPPPHTCVQTKVVGCYNDTDTTAPVLPEYQPQLHDKVTIEACASACFGLKQTLAGIDAGNHCYCGNQVGGVVGGSRPLHECYGDPCHANSTEKQCGGEHRMLVYTFSCQKR